MALAICDHCNEPFLGATCPRCDRPPDERGDIRRLPREVVVTFVEHAEGFLAAGPRRQAILAFAAGSFIGFGVPRAAVRRRCCTWRRYRSTADQPGSRRSSR